MFEWFKSLFSPKEEDEQQSPEAATEGVCHTFEECDKMYADLSPELKAPALKLLAKDLAPDVERIRTAYAEDPEGWYTPYHFFWGMSVRNLLRREGFGEDYFGVHNLDDIYIALVEEALDLHE